MYSSNCSCPRTGDIAIVDSLSSHKLLLQNLNESTQKSSTYPIMLSRNRIEDDLSGLTSAESEMSFDMKLKTIEMLALMRGMSPQSILEIEQTIAFKNSIGYYSDDEEKYENIDDYDDGTDSEYLVGESYEDSRDDTTLTNARESDLTIDVDIVEEGIFDIEL